MQCPVCQETLGVADRQGIEIDYCPKCRGIWLDRGELEKLIDRSVDQARPTSRYADREENDSVGEFRDRPGKVEHYGEQHRKRESWLGRLLDFD